MRPTLIILSTTVVLSLVLTLATAPNQAEETKIPTTPEEFAKAMAEAGTPGAEHAKLKPLAGSWTYTCRFWMDPGAEPVETKGTIERNWILGGRFLEEKTVGTGFNGTSDFEALGLFGYDNSQKKYTLTFACNMGTGTCTGQGDADKSGKALTFSTECYCPVLKKTIKGRDNIRIESNDKVVMESYKIEGGKEIKVMELVSLRTK